MTIVVNRSMAEDRYGEGFLFSVMGARKRVALTERQHVILERAKLMKVRHFVPFAYSYVYFIQNDRNKFKVGHTISPSSRVSALKTGTTDNLEMVAVIIVGNDQARNVERAIHTILKGRGGHVRGEWFEGDALSAYKAISEEIRHKYSRCIINPEDGFLGCEPVYQLYVSANTGFHPLPVLKKFRSEYINVLKARNLGLTVMS